MTSVDVPDVARARAAASPTVIGFDGSLTGAGIAVWHDGLWNLDVIRTPAHQPVEERWDTICGALWRKLTSHCLVVVEGVFVGSGKGTAGIDMVMLHAVIRRGLHKRGIPVAVPHHTRVKAFATGKGAHVSKQAMVTAARTRLSIPVHDHNAADAAWCAAMGLHRYGNPLCSTTREQDAAVAAADWPTWSFNLAQAAS